MPVGVDLALVLGLAAVLLPLVYLVSDVVEVAQGGFSTPGLVLTYVGEAGIPLVVVGLLGCQSGSIGRVGTVGALAYAYSFVFFTGTVLWALVAGTPSWEVLGQDLGAWMTVHGAVMVVGGIGFGVGVVRAGVFPRWTGWTLGIGVLLVAAASGSGDLERASASVLPDAALVGMGVHLIRGWRDPRAGQHV